MRDDRQRLRDILEAIDRIQDRTGEGREAFEDNELLQVWVIYHLQVLGEAALHVSESLRSAHPDIPWQQLSACATSWYMVISKRTSILCGRWWRATCRFCDLK